MWTPKRVLLLLAGFALFFTAYLFYARYLGGIDGLTPLPEAYWPSENVTDEGPPIVVSYNVAERKLKQAFGEASEEIKRPIKLNMPNRGLVLAVDDFKILEEDNSKVLLKPFSIAIFKYPADGGYPEINTVRSEEAILQLDQPIKVITEIGSRKIIGAVLYRDIQVVNNRRTPERTDDLSLYTVGPMSFDDAKHLIWTQNEVKLIDIKTQPQPTSITARGMDIYLKVEAPDAQKAPPGQAKGKGGDRISDVERIELRSNVRMDLWTDGQSGFLSAGTSDKKKPAAPLVGPPAPEGAAPASRSKIVITTDGKFVYDLNTSRARFDIPPRSNPFHPEIVTVIRENEGDLGKHDQLQCEHLELQFVRKPVPGARGRASSQSDSLEIESAHATGKSLTLASDNEVLDAFGNDLFYDATKKLSILKGDPMVALKEGNEIHAHELWMGPTADGSAQQAIAIGPGEIALKERAIEGSSEVRTLKARWQDKLIRVQEGKYDLLTLTGNAMFDDPQNGQRLRGERLRVWLEPAPASKDANPKEDGQNHLRPHHIEARGHVTADAPDLHIKEPTENLVIWFKDVPEKPVKVPDGVKPAPAAAVSTDVAKAPAAPPSAPPVIGAPAKPVVGAPTAPNPQFVGPPAPEKPKPPIDLTARSVEVYAVRSGQKTDLERLWCEGDVHAHQDPEDPRDQPMEVHGDTMNLNYAPEGGILLVEGKLAQVQFNKMAIVGPSVNIDQRTNKATVNGSGAMRMLSDTDFDGNKRTEPTEMTVQWKEKMLFTGMNAEFYGGVQAVQDNGNSRLLCQVMQVVFDRPISLKEGNHGGQPAKVDKLVCHQSVEIEEIRKEKGQLLSIRRLVSPLVNMDNADKTLEAPGPGEVRIYQLGSADDDWKPGATGTSAAKPAPGAQKPVTPGKQEAASEYKITHVRFQGKMWGRTQEPRKVTFFDNVEAVHGPATQPDMVVDVDKLPAGWMFIQCGRLDVLTRRLAEGRVSQEMIAQHKVQVQAQEFWGNADVVKYEEAYERVIFEGRDSPAVLFRILAPGATPERLTGMKIFYYRKTNTFDVQKSTGLSTN